MKKIIIVGHNQENNEMLETLFQHFGMKKALPSRREGLTPIQVGELLSKAIKSQAPQIQEIDEEELLKKLPPHISKRRLKKNLKKQQSTQAATALPKSMWDYIPMDLMIANIDNEFWGWADKNALENLEYWKNLDPSIYFVLTYDRPQSLLLELEHYESNSNIDKVAILEKFNDWTSYNTKILDFLEKNPKRAILVNNERIYQKNMMKLVYSQVAPSNLNNTDVIIDSDSFDQKQNLSPLFKIISNKILKTSPEVMDTYNQLQSKSHFPYLDEIDDIDNLDSLIDVWKENVENRKIFKEKINSTTLENELLLSQLHHVQEEFASHIDKSSSEKSELLKEYEKFKVDKEKLLQEYENKQKSLDKVNVELENKLSISLSERSTLLEEKSELLKEYEKFKVDKEKLLQEYENKQKSLDKVNVELENKLSISLSERSTLLEEKSELLKEKEEILNRYKNEKTNLENAKHEIEEKLTNSLRDNDLLLSQLHLVQEELFEFHLGKSESDKKLFGAADRFKNELTYRIGSTLVKNSQSLIGWLKIPFALWNEYSVYREDKKIKEKLNLPSIEQYEDFYEVAKIKRHLSYKLGYVFLKNIKSPIGWICLPFSIAKEVQNFRKQRNKK